MSDVSVTVLVNKHLGNAEEQEKEAIGNVYNTSVSFMELELNHRARWIGLTMPSFFLKKKISHKSIELDIFLFCDLFPHLCTRFLGLIVDGGSIF